MVRAYYLRNRRDGDNRVRRDDYVDDEQGFGLTSCVWSYDAYESVSPLDPSLAISHTVNLTGLAMYTTYHFKVVSQDSQR